jgi:hypothetical protein
LLKVLVVAVVVLLMVMLIMEIPVEMVVMQKEFSM